MGTGKEEEEREERERIEVLKECLEGKLNDEGELREEGDKEGKEEEEEREGEDCGSSGASAWGGIASGLRFERKTSMIFIRKA